MIQLSNDNITGVTYSTDHYDHYEKHGDKNYFEEIVDKMILDGIDGMNESFRTTISSLSRDKKRMAILSLLDKDRSLFKSIKALVDKDINKMDHIKDVVLMLREYVKVGKVEKRKFGEVMTPLSLVKEMLATLPEEVWSNPKLKWLDPANGTGPYPIMVIYKLMNGLRDWEPDDEKRYKHIVENMIYVCELQPKNMFLYMCAVDPFDTYKLNIYTGSFLDTGFDKHMKDVWSVDNFEIVLGNPPYQKSDGSGGKGSSATPIYNLFTEKSIKLSNSVLFITPSRWFSGGRGLNIFRNMMINRNDIKIIKHFGGSGVDIFGSDVEIKGGVSYFLIDKSYNGDILFNDVMLDNTSIRLYGSILYDDIHYKILNKIKSDVFFNLKVQSSNYFGKVYNGVKTLRNSKECVSDRLDDDYLRCYVSKKEGFIKYVNKNFSISSNVDKYKVFTVKGTNVGSMGNTFIGYPNEICSETYLTILCDSEEESENIIDYFKTDFVKYLFKLMNITQNSSKETYRLIPFLNFNKNWTSVDLYSFYKLTDDEIIFIEKFIK
jgi:site-specific DNA-methyltransferase (adenine-specific)